LAVNISGIAKPNRKKEWWQLLSCAGGNSTSLRQSATVHLSMKEIVSNESQLAYVMANTVGGQQQAVSARQGDQEDQDDQQRRRPKNPAKTSCSSSMSDPETFVTQEQTIQMKSFRNRRPLSVQQQPPQKPEEQPAQEQKAATTKLAAVGMISESTSCSCTNGDHNVVTTTTLEEEVSVFSADASADNDIAQK
jgi:hypothetical protein